MSMDENSDSIENPQNDGCENDESMQPAAELVMGTKLTDINIDCQELIFKNLGLVDLLNVVDANKQFKAAANLVFAKKFGNVEVKAILICPSRYQYEGDVEEEIGRIRYAKTYFQLLRNFGHLIRVLDFDPSKILQNTPQEKLFPILSKGGLDYINEYCGESLTEIRIGQCPEGFMKFLKPLPNVETVDVKSYGFEGLPKDSLNTLFPKLYRLKYLDFDQSLGLIENHFPHLEHLTVHRGLHRGNKISWKNIRVDVFELNPQLRSLHFDIGSDVNVLRCIENLHQLERLYLVWNTKIVPVDNNFGGEIFRLRMVKTFKIWFREYDNDSVELPCIPFTFNQLEKCRISDGSFNIEELYNFLDRNPTIKELKLKSRCRQFNLWKIQQALPSLCHFNVSPYGHFSEVDIADFVNALPSLKKACFTTLSKINVDELMISLGNQWQTSVQVHYIYTELTLERLI